MVGIAAEDELAGEKSSTPSPTSVTMPEKSMPTPRVPFVGPKPPERIVRSTGLSPA
ncbi:hypothetical protein K4X33_03855 [Brevibacterium casei]|nr:hypothetical protein K4X33_03855 [Brevibacterium casei]